MTEIAIVGAQAAVLHYKPETRNWAPAGAGNGGSRVELYRNEADGSYRVVGRNMTDQSVVINSMLYPNMEYRRANDTFHQWQDARYVYGLNFPNKDEANIFGTAVEKAVHTLSNAAPVAATATQPQSVAQPTTTAPQQQQQQQQPTPPLVPSTSSTSLLTTERRPQRPLEPIPDAPKKNNIPSNKYQTLPSKSRSPLADSIPRPEGSSVPLQQLFANSVPPMPSQPVPPQPQSPSVPVASDSPQSNSDESEDVATYEENSLAAQLNAAKLKKRESEAQPAPQIDSASSTLDSLAAQISAAKLKKRDSMDPPPPPAVTSGGGVLDEMQAKLAKRRSQVNNPPPAENGSKPAPPNLEAVPEVSAATKPATNGPASIAAAPPPPADTPGEIKPKPKKTIKKDSIATPPVKEVSDDAMAQLRKDLRADMHKELEKFKQEIIEAIRAELGK